MTKSGTRADTLAPQPVAESRAKKSLLSQSYDRIASVEMYLHLPSRAKPGKPRSDIVGLIARENIGLRVSRYLADRFGADRERGIRVCAREAAKLLGVRSRARFTRPTRPRSR